jgi:hypothetical protein
MPSVVTWHQIELATATRHLAAARTTVSRQRALVERMRARKKSPTDRGLKVCCLEARNRELEGTAATIPKTSPPKPARLVNGVEIVLLYCLKLKSTAGHQAD